MASRIGSLSDRVIVPFPDLPLMQSFWKEHSWQAGHSYTHLAGLFGLSACWVCFNSNVFRQGICTEGDITGADEKEIERLEKEIREALCFSGTHSLKYIER